MNDAVNKNIGRGFFMEAAEKKGFEKGMAVDGHGRAVRRNGNEQDNLI